MNKILVFGSGSIGQRHIKALIKLGENNIAAYRTLKGTIKKLSESIDNKIKIFYNLEKALDWDPTHIIISNPTKLHLEFLKIGIERNAKIFIEKPIADSIDDIINSDELSKNEIENYKNGIVGYNLRFSEIFNKIKNLIKSKEYGEVLSAYLEVGHYLPFWHPYEDYRKSYAARNDLGGGALNTLSHEIDLVIYLFGKVKKVFAKVNKISDLKINVDDNTDLFFETNKCNSIRIHLDYLKPKPVRKGEIQFEEGLLKYNYNNNEVKFIDYEERNNLIIYDKEVDYNDQYINQMKSFLSGDENNIACSLSEGLEILNIIKKSRLSSNKGVEYEN